MRERQVGLLPFQLLRFRRRRLSPDAHRGFLGELNGMDSDEYESELLKSTSRVR